MGSAKECDRCRLLYKENEDNEMPYSVANTEENMDLCPQCQYDLEEFMENPTHKKAKRKNNWSDEAKAKKSEEMRERTQVASYLKDRDDLTWKEGMSASAKLKKNDPKKFKELYAQIQSDEDEVEESEPVKRKTSYRCTMCGEGDFSKPHQMCAECHDHFDKE